MVITSHRSSISSGDTSPTEIGQWKAVTIVHRRITGAVTASSRMASWIRRGYPRQAPQRGHCYLLALCGVDCAAR